MRFWTWVKLRTQEVRWHFKLNENGNKTERLKNEPLVFDPPGNQEEIATENDQKG